MAEWIENLIDSIGNAITGAFEHLSTEVSNNVWNEMLQWMYKTLYQSVADFFSLMGNMGIEIFELGWVKSTVLLFRNLGWALFVVGLVVAIFDVAIEYQNGRANIKTTSINILKGFFACSLVSVVPIELHYTDKQKIEEAILDKFPESRKASNPVKKALSGGQTLSEEDIAVAEKYSADGDLEPREPQPKKPKLKTSEE